MLSIRLHAQVTSSESDIASSLPYVDILSPVHPSLVCDGWVSYYIEYYPFYVDSHPRSTVSLTIVQLNNASPASLQSQWILRCVIVPDVLPSFYCPCPNTDLYLTLSPRQSWRRASQALHRCWSLRSETNWCFDVRKESLVSCLAVGCAFSHVQHKVTSKT